MLITSFDRPAAALGARNWRKLHRTGFWTLALFFAFTFRNDVPKVPDEPVYFSLAVLALGAASVRVLAILKRRRKQVAMPAGQAGTD